MNDALNITRQLHIPLSEITFEAMRAQGAGGQNVNKVSSAIHLRFDIRQSSLPDLYKERLLALADQRISKEGVIIIKSQQSRSQEQNKQDALQRLADLIRTVTITRKKRKPTKPGKAARQRRMDAKGRRGKVKQTRQRVRGSFTD